ncbi:hypothetical protein [Gordonia zhaorongruii]|uniref:hypothetical protein n=1 Tax=Gordonia zhaorongruii TaxID=2597659 RepID=UPI0010507DA7|nr:hypothetical protein [Gordonia zhaorongruii]
MKPAMRGAGIIGMAVMGVVVGALGIAYFLVGTSDPVGDPPANVRIGESASKDDDVDDRSPVPNSPVPHSPGPNSPVPNGPEPKPRQAPAPDATQAPLQPRVEVVPPGSGQSPQFGDDDWDDYGDDDDDDDDDGDDDHGGDSDDDD